MTTIPTKIFRKFVMCCCAVSLVIGLALWGRQPDRYHRDQIDFRETDGQTASAIVVSSRQHVAAPLLFYFHVDQISSQKTGAILRKIVDAGFTTIGLGIGPTNSDKYEEVINGTISKLAHRSAGAHQGTVWMTTGIALDFALRFLEKHPDKHPDLLLCLPDKNGVYFSLSATNSNAPNFACSILVLTPTDLDKVSSLEQLTKWLANGTNKLQQFYFSGSQSEAGILPYLEMAQQARQTLSNNGESINAGPLPRLVPLSDWIFFAPATALLLLYVTLLLKDRSQQMTWLTLRELPARSAFFGGIILGSAVSFCALYFDRSSSRSHHERGNVTSNLINKLGLGSMDRAIVGDYLQLADYDRRLANWSMDDSDYESYVLSPALGPTIETGVDWRWKLWRFFYPKIRKTNTTLEAATILVEGLREEIEINSNINDQIDVDRIWNSRTTDCAGFHVLYVAALRSIGVAARLNDKNLTEILDNGKWIPAPPPASIIAR